MLQGDLNDLQQLALICVKGEEMKQSFDAEWRMFKYMAIAAHPENTKEIIEALDGARAEAEAQINDGPAEWATPITDEEILDYQPVSTYAQDIIDDLRQFGVAVREIPD